MNAVKMRSCDVIREKKDFHHHDLKAKFKPGRATFNRAAAFQRNTNV